MKHISVAVKTVRMIQSRERLRLIEDMSSLIDVKVP